MYLSIGECDGSLGPDDMYLEAMRVIFKENKPCHRFPQLRWSKRHPGKYRWVLYEMWPLSDPITHQKAVLVCEQNISQVKALEEQFKKQNQRSVSKASASPVCVTAGVHDLSTGHDADWETAQQHVCCMR